jgi:hypothetical protein
MTMARPMNITEVELTIKLMFAIVRLISLIRRF